MKARVVVTLKEGILDPQGNAIEVALKSLGSVVSTACGKEKYSKSNLLKTIESRRKDCFAVPARNCSPTRSLKISKWNSANFSRVAGCSHKPT